VARIETSIQIDRAPEDVYAYATDVDNMTQWLGAVVEAERLTEGPLGVGTRIRAVGKMLGRRMDSLAEVTALEPDARFAFKVASGPLTSHNSYAFESVAGGTKVTDTVEIELGGILGLADPLMGRMMRRRFDANLAVLKARLEAQAASGG
jgi:uncharacterized protein YndB with AHSA1/START domain